MQQLPIIILPPPPPVPAPPVVLEVYPDTTLDLMNAIFTALGGTPAEIEEKYFDRGDDLLYAILKKIHGGIGSPQGDEGTHLLSGNASWSGTGYDFDVTVCTYYILNNLLTSPATTVTLVAADLVNDRIDVIAVNDNNEVEVLTGVPAPNPIKPQCDYSTQCEVSFVYVKAGSGQPTTIQNEIVYAENVEWAHNTPPSAAIDFENMDNPQSGVKNIKLSTYNTGFPLRFVKGQLLNVNDYTFLRFYIKIDTIGADDGQFKIMQIFLQNGPQTISTSFQIKQGVLGFDANNIGWQLISIPLSSFAFSSSNFDTVYFRISSTTVEDIQLDNIVLQGAVHNAGVIVQSQLGNNYLLGIDEDTDGQGALTTTKI